MLRKLVRYAKVRREEIWLNVLADSVEVMGVAFLIALAAQMTRKRYTPAVYWVVVVLISVVGKLISDTLVDKYNIALSVTSTVFAVMLAIVFVAWQRSEKTLSVHDVRMTKRE